MKSERSPEASPSKEPDKAPLNNVMRRKMIFLKGSKSKFSLKVNTARLNRATELKIV